MITTVRTANGCSKLLTSFKKGLIEGTERISERHCGSPAVWRCQWLGVYLCTEHAHLAQYCCESVGALAVS